MRSFRIELPSEALLDHSVEGLTFDDVAALFEQLPREWLERRTLPERIWIYGGGTLGRDMFSKLSQVGFVVAGFIDRHPENFEGMLYGRPVLEPECAVSEPIFAAVFNVGPCLSEVRRWARDEVFSYAQLLCAAPSALPYWCLNAPTSPIDPSERKMMKLLEARLDDSHRGELSKQFAARRKVGLHRIGDMSHTPADEYFADSASIVRAAETFLDIGAFDGDTVTRFLDLAPHSVRVVAIEPDELSFASLQSRFREESRVTPLRRLVGRNNGYGRLMTSGTVNSVAVQEGGDEVRKVTVDELLEQFPYVSRIKVDVEGAEQEVLQGASQTIAKADAACTLSTYHRPDDIWCLAAKFPERLYRPEVASHACRPWDTTVTLIPQFTRSV